MHVLKNTTLSNRCLHSAHVCVCVYPNLPHTLPNDIIATGHDRHYLSSSPLCTHYTVGVTAYCLLNDTLEILSGVIHLSRACHHLYRWSCNRFSAHAHGWFFCFEIWLLSNPIYDRLQKQSQTMPRVAIRLQGRGCCDGWLAKRA